MSTFYQWRSHFNNRLKDQEKDGGIFIPLSIKEEGPIKERSPSLASAVIDERSLSLPIPPLKGSDNVSVGESSQRLGLQNKPLKEGFDLHIGEKLLLKIPFGFDAIELKRLVGVLC